MGDYYYTVRRKPDFVAKDGTPVHTLRYAYKPSWYPSKAEDDRRRRYLDPVRRSWASSPLKAPIYLCYGRNGKAFNGADVYRMEDLTFTGVLLDAALGTLDAEPAGILLLKDGHGAPEVISRAQEQEAWAGLGAWWKSAAQCLRETAPGYRPSIDVSLPEGLLAARVYDAVAASRNDERRAYRYGADRAQRAA